MKRYSLTGITLDTRLGVHSEWAPVFSTCQLVSETASDKTMIFNSSAAMTALGEMDFEGDGGTTV